MTPVGHYATSMLTGTVAWKMSGSPSVGLITALLTHIPADLVLNEFYEWGKDRSRQLANYLRMIVCLVPAIVLLCVVSFEKAMFLPALFGASGILLDVLDESFKKIFGFPVFPCHHGSPFYIPEYFKKDSFVEMSSIGLTAMKESLLTIVASLITLAIILNS